MPLLVPAQHTRQCSRAALSSRLSPYALSHGEHLLLRGRVAESEFKNYLFIRNSILRLWTRNPLVAVTRDEALECMKDRRYTSLAAACHEWLVRNGYINFGCVEISQIKNLGLIPDSAPQRVVVIVGAGISALSCARQLQSIFHQFADRWIKQKGEQLPRVVLLEGRRRVGGRVYSHPLRDQQRGALPNSLANSAELGAQIITGFDSGNPLDAVVRGQLALDYHLLRDNMLLYDHDGSLVDDDTDARMQDFFNDILELASEHPSSWKPAVKVPTTDGLRTTLAPASDLFATTPSKDSREVPSPTKNSMFPGLMNHNGKRLRLDPDAYTKHPSLGSLMDQLVTQEQREKGLAARDMRVLNWHYANLEYGNAINVSQLSLGGWDQDSGNEFEGQHSMIVGGYSQVVRGLVHQPTTLDIRLDRKVETITYQPTGSIGTSKVTTTHGETFYADYVVSTLPLGVMHANDVAFDPPLPPWKTAALHRMGFGVLNKLILLFDEPFWPPDRDMFGLCNAPPHAPTSTSQPDYARHRGRFYLFWNCLKSTGRPILVALLAGDAANDTDEAKRASSAASTPTAFFDAGSAPHSPTSPEGHESTLIASALATLATIFKQPSPPRPREAIITRWRSDPFARGSYSYLGPDAQPGDYDAIARPVGSLHFAGEATCGTHPATVHGAFLSGMRAASEIVESMLGPVAAPVMK